MVAVNNLLHLFLPFDFEFLPGLLPGIGQVAVFQLVGFQQSQVHKRNAPQVETHQVEVAGKGHFGILAQIQVLYFFYGLDGDGPLGGLVHTGIDIRKGVPVYGKFLFHGSVVNGTQVAVVKRRGIPAQPAIIKQVMLILFNQVFIYLVQTDVALLSTEAQETVHG